jgi:hypothetical protein
LIALDADIIALSECRDTPLKDDAGTIVPIARFLAEVAGTRYAIVNQDGVATPLHTRQGVLPLHTGGQA